MRNKLVHANNPIQRMVRVSTNSPVAIAVQLFQQSMYVASVPDRDARRVIGATAATKAGAAAALSRMRYDYRWRRLAKVKDPT